MKIKRNASRTKLARGVFRAPIILTAVILSALLGLSSCGGGGGEAVKPVDDDDFMIMPPVGGGSGKSGSDSFFGAISGQLSPAGTGSCGLAAGVATGYTSQAAAKAAAISRCRQAGGTDCETLVLEYGSAYQGANSCGALAYGHRTGAGCLIRFGRNETRKAAEEEAIASCERTSFARNNGLDCAHRIVSDCSASDPASSYSRSVSGSGTSNTNVNPGGNPGVNQAPQIKSTFTIVNMEQGSTSTFRNVSTVFFSDPDNDRLRITATSISPTFASVRISGDDLIIVGERGFTGPNTAVTIIVTATDPGGLSVSQTITVRVTATEVRTSRWIAISVQETFQGCTGLAAAIRRGSSQQAAEQAALAACNSLSSRSSCFSSKVLSTTGCVAYAEGDRCGGEWVTRSTLVSARNAALAGCRARTSNCRVEISGCASN